jgi:L-amino acid N-acyltransferase YncA
MNLQLGPISMADRKEIVDIFNHYTETSFAAFLDHPLPYNAFEAILNKCKGFPTVAAKDEQGYVVGFGLLHAYNPFPVFSGTAELSYFIKPEWTGRGIGTMMLAYLCQKAQDRGITTLLASISSLNDQSLRFHLRKGFNQCGCFKKVGRKKNEPFDIIYMQKFL